MILYGQIPDIETKKKITLIFYNKIFYNKQTIFYYIRIFGIINKPDIRYPSSENVNIQKADHIALNRPDDQIS